MGERTDYKHIVGGLSFGFQKWTSAEVGHFQRCSPSPQHHFSGSSCTLLQGSAPSGLFFLLLSLPIVVSLSLRLITPFLFPYPAHTSASNPFIKVSSSEPSGMTSDSS